MGVETGVEVAVGVGVADGFGWDRRNAGAWPGGDVAEMGGEHYDFVAGESAKETFAVRVAAVGAAA